MTFKIEAGKFYRTRDGRKVGPMEYTNWGDGYPWVSDSLKWYTHSGEGSLGVEDIVAEWTDEPETGTLAELNVKPGDVVQTCYKGPVAQYQHTVGRVCDGRYYSKTTDGELGDAAPWRIVSRASQPDTPKLLKDMTDAEIGALVRAANKGQAVEAIDPSNPNDTWREITRPDFDDEFLDYRIRPEPKRETVTLYSADGFAWSSLPVTNARWRQTYDLIDGKPDPASIRMEEL